MKTIYFYNTPQRQKNFDAVVAALSDADIPYEFGMRVASIRVDIWNFERAMKLITAALVGADIDRVIYVV